MFCEYWDICREDEGDLDDKKETDKRRKKIHTQ